ncbi:MAG: FG-GAP-like repeat-containing protein [Cyanobacteriota bacterium]|nr:FG-GAP-like repeat-containing protein [Cyanobacteriota bacterium]
MASFRCLVALEHGSPLALALQRVDERLLGWASHSEGFDAVLLQAFGVQIGGARAEDLRASLLGEGLEVGLAVQALPGLRGAYVAASGSTPEVVLLDGDWLAGASGDALEAVLLEELGHVLDQRLNGILDSPGDEGEIFSALLRGVAPSASSVSENDQRWMPVGGQPRLVEAADTTAPKLLLNGSRRPFFAGSAIAFGLPDVGDSAHPSFVDIDGDSDLDVFIGKRDGRTLFFENVGTATVPIFAGSVSVIGLIDVGVLSTPSFVDIDADGDLDAFIGNQDGNTLFFRNSGSPSSPAFSSSSRGFGLLDVGTNASPSFVDIDADGDLDAFIGESAGSTLFFRNTGSNFSAAYGISSIPFGLGHVGFSAQPTFADIDADGDFDAFIGNNAGNILFFRNSGTPANPAFAGPSFGFDLPDFGFYASPSLVDIDADGDLDLFVGTDYGNTLFMINDGNYAVTSTTTDGIYGPDSTITIQLSFTESVVVTGSPNILLETGSTDRIATYSSGSGTNTLSFRYTVQTGDATADLDTTANTSLRLNGGTIKDAAGNNAILTLPEPGAAGSLGANAALVIDGVAPVVGSEGVRLSLSATPGGVNGAGAGARVYITVWMSEDVSVNTVGGTPTLALETGRIDGTATYLTTIGRRLLFEYTVQNGDSSADLDYTATTALQLNGATIRDAAGNTANLTLPAPGADGSLGSALLSTVVDGVAPNVALNGSRTPTFASSASGFGLTDVGDGASPTFADIDADGDLDVFIGTSIGNTLFFRNTGQPSSPAFAASNRYFGFPDVGTNARPSLADIDADGDLDVFLGANSGNTLFFRNTGTAAAAAFAGSASSFGLPDVGATASPAFADIDADGDLDAFIGNSAGRVLFFRNSGSRINAAFAGSSIAFDLPTVGTSAYPTFADIDADGDLDAFVGNSGGNTFFFRNTGNPASAAFAGSSLAFGLPKVAAHAVPSLADIDADGDLDAFIGEAAGTTLFFRNTGRGGLTTTNADGTYGIGQPITILVPFSEDLVLDTSGGTPTLLLETGGSDRTASYSGGSGTKNLHFLYVVQAGDVSVDLDASAANALQLNGAILTDLVGNNASLTLPEPGTAGSLAANGALVIDGVAPVVSTAGLTSTTANGIHGAGSLITILVPFTKVVNVDTSAGSPTLLLETGSTDQSAIYSGGSGTNSLRFLYTVQPGDNSADLDVSSSSALQLNGASISDASGNPATLAMPSPGTAGSLGANASLVIDALRPVVAASGLSSSSANGSYGINRVITIRVPFTKIVYVNTAGGIPTLQLALGSPTQAAIYSGGSGTNTLSFQYTVQPGDESADLDIASTSALQLNGASISDASGLLANLTLPAPGAPGSLAANATLVMDGVVPVLASAGLSSDPAGGSQGSGSVITIRVPFSEVLSVDTTGGTPTLLLETGSDDSIATYSGGSDTTTLLFTYTAQPGDASPDLDIHSPSALQLNGASISDAAGNAANLSLPAPGEAGSLAANAALVIDTTAPSLIGSTPSDDATAISETGLIQLHFSEAVRAGSGQIALWREGGVLVETFAAASGSGSAGGNVAFNGNTVRIVLSDFASSTGYYLTIADTAITDLTGNAYAGFNDDTTLHFTTGDSILPSVTDVSSVTTEGSHAPGDTILLTIRFSEPVTVVTTGGMPSLLLDTGSSARAASYISGSGSDTLSFAYTVGSGDSSLDLTYSNRDALRLNGGSIRDVAGNPANLTLPSPDAPGSLGLNTALVIDGVAPAVAHYGSYNTAYAVPSTCFSPSHSVINAAKPAFADIDGDGDLDAFIGELYGHTLFFRNTGTRTNPEFAGSANAFGLPDVGYVASPTFVDIDADGDLDAFVGESSGHTYFFRNTGSSSSPAFAGSSTGFALPNLGYSVKPTFADIDADGDLDAFIGERDGTVFLFRNSGTAASAAFASCSSGAGLLFAMVSASPSLADIDGDGDLDAFVGTSSGDTILFRNTGTAWSPAFATGDIAFDLPQDTYSVNPSLVDIDADGDVDVFIGTFQNNTLFFRNTGTVGLYSTSADGTFAPGSQLTIQVPFSEDVFVESSVGSPPFLLLETGSDDSQATYVSGSGTNTLSFHYTVRPGDSSADLDVTSPTALHLNGGRIRDAAGNDAILSLPVPGEIGSLSATAALVIDGVVPSVTSLTTSAANGVHGLDQTITIHVQCSEVVTVASGSAPPSLRLETGSNDRLAIYSGGSGTRTLSFLYTVAAGDVSADLEVTSSEALQLNTGSIRDLAGNHADLTLPAPGAAGSLGANAALVVDGVAPAVTAAGLTSIPATGAYGVGQAITIRLPFTESVTVSGTPSLLLETGGTDRAATYSGGSGTNTLSFRYTVQPGDSSADLDVHSSAVVLLNGGGIRDAANNPANLALPSPGTSGSLGANSALVIDGVVPVVAPAGLTSSSANGTYGVGQVITIQVPFSESVSVNTAAGRPILVLETGTVDQIATYSGGSGTNILSFQYTVQPGDRSADLDVASTTALQLNGAVIRDAQNNLANLTLKAPGTAGSLAANAALVIDAVGPAVAFNGARMPAFAGSSIGFGLANVGAFARPSFVDIDADGDLDAFIAGIGRAVPFFRNTGTPTHAAFAGSSIAFGLTIGFSLASSPGFVDIDADGDLDVVYVNTDRNALILRNTGTASNPAFGSTASIPGLTNLVISAHPSFVDIDADGDLDAILGGEDGITRFYRNTGSQTQAAYAPGSLAFGFPNVRFSATPTFVDIDADDDLDAFIGNIDGNVFFFRNSGTATTAAFAASSLGFGLPTAGQFIKPTFVDIDADGDLDAFIGHANGNTVFFRNTGSGSLLSTTANGSHGLGTVITILLPFNEVVYVNTSAGVPTLLLETGSTDRPAVYVGGSGSRTLRFRYMVQPGDTSPDLDITTSSALKLNGATILDAMGNAARPTLPSPGSLGSLAAAGALVIDGVVPAVTSLGLTSTSANGNYNVGRVITIQVPFSETVTVNTASGTPTLLLETGAIDRSALYSGGSGTSTLSFQYTVQNGDSSADLDVSSSAALQRNGATIRDAAGNDANPQVPAPGSAGSLAANAVLRIDGVAPAVTSAGVASTRPDGSYATGAVLSFRVPFSESVTVNTSQGLPSLLLETGNSDRQAIYTSGSGTDSLVFTYTIQAGDDSSDLDIHSTEALQLNGATIRDMAGNTANLTLPQPGGVGSLAWNANLTIDASAPALIAEGLTATSLYGVHGIGSEITILVPFKEVVSVETSGGTPTLLLETGDSDRAALYSGGSGTNTLRFRYTVAPGDNSTALDVTSPSALQLNGATIRDAANLDASLSLPAPGGVGSLAANAAITIDGIAPKVALHTPPYPAFAASAVAFGLPDLGLGSPYPRLIDIDADGDLDAFIGTPDGQLAFFPNTGTSTQAVFAGSATPFGLPNAEESLSPTFADIDSDGDLDAFFGQYSGSTLFFRNTGTATQPSFAGSSIGFGLPDVGERSTPNFVDIDADGDLDAFIGSDDGYTRFYRNTGSPTAPAFAESSLGFGLDVPAAYANPAFADIDADGDLDAFIGTYDGTTPLFRNTGTALNAAFAASSIGVGLPAVHARSNPVVVDIDADGDLDAFVGNYDGNVLFFRNTSPIGLSSANASATYGSGDVITIQVAFSEAVNVDTSGGSPTLLLETGSSDRLAYFSGGSGTNLLSFQYTVQPGDNTSDLDIHSISALQLNGASIRDFAANETSLLLPSPGAARSLAAAANLVIDAVAPTLISANPADNANDVNESANLQLTFSEPVQAGTGTIQLWRADNLLIEAFDVSTSTGSAGGSMLFSGNSVSLNPFADLASSTSFYLLIGDTTLLDRTGNAHAGSSDASTLNFNTGDSMAPSVRHISGSVSDGTYGGGALISIGLRFSEAVIVTLNGSAPSLLLETGVTDRTATYVSGSGTHTLSFAYSVQSGDQAADLDLVTGAALQFNGSWIKDAAGNNASSSLPAPGSAGSLGANSALVINGSSAQQLIVTNSTPSVNEGSNLSVRVSSGSFTPGATLYWRFSGVGITAADVNPPTLDGSLILGSDRQALVSYAVNADGVAEGDEQLILTFFSDPARTRPLAGAQFTLHDLTATGLDGATDERDMVIGTGGDDLIRGVPVGSVLNGKGSYDTLTGQEGNDTFILGIASAVFYDDGDPTRSSAADLAAITDFSAGDRIQLKGTAAGYRLSSSSLGGVSGLLLFWRAAAGAGTTDEAIGFIQGQTLATLSLTNSNQFQYV